MSATPLSWQDRLRPSRVTEGWPVLPLLILFGLNAVDELDRTAFAILTPNIRDHFNLDLAGILGLVGGVTFLALGGQVIVGYYADRRPRVRMAILGASTWALFTLGTGLAPTIALLAVARVGSALGKAVIDPTHNSLIADYYPPEVRLKAYGFHRAANSVGQIIGPLVAGGLAFYFGWRLPFIVLAVPTALLVALAIAKLREPVRGAHERAAMGASDELVNVEEPPPSFGEAWRIAHQVRTMRRLFASLPFLGVGLGGLTSLFSLYYNDEFGLNEVQRALVSTLTEPFQIAGLAIGIPLTVRLARRDPGLVLKVIAISSIVLSLALAVFAASPVLWLSVAMHVIVAILLVILLPGIYATISLVMPPRARSVGFSLGALYLMPAGIIIAIIGQAAESSGVRGALAATIPVSLLGGFILASAGRFVRADMANMHANAVARAAVISARHTGTSKLLLVSGLDVGYDQVQVLFGVDFEVEEGEIVALLGTNGAGKSTLLKSISGLLPATAGAVVFDGHEMTAASPQEIAARGVIQVPGGKGAFPGLTVAENLRIAGWLNRADSDYLRDATEEVLGFFPVLRARWDQPAGNLSGGEQQMLTLGQAFISKPRLLMIDELSLGLAPIIVEQLLGIVRAIAARGTTIILVEQSVNVALTVANTAYFMEKGEIRFHGATSELLARPDILRSVFLEGAGVVGASPAANGNGNGTKGGGSRRTESARARKTALVTAAERPVVLEARELTKRYGGIEAVSEVSFTLGAGEILGFIGPNGAGKTTLFDLISGFTEPDRGHLLVDDVDLTETGPDLRARHGLGRSFQDARLFPALTVVETIALSLERHAEVRDPIAAALGLPAVADSERAIATRVDELIDLMGLGAFADKFVSELSTGSRRIVDLACILGHDPKVILFDEPSSGIAQRETEALGPLLLGIRETSGASLLVIEHDMPLITGVADRLVAMDLGRVVAVDTPHAVINHPHVIASYLGSTEDVIHRSGTKPSAPKKPRTRTTKTAAPAARR